MNKQCSYCQVKKVFKFIYALLKTAFYCALVFVIIYLFLWVSNDSYNKLSNECEKHGWTVRTRSAGHNSPPCIDKNGNGKWL